MATHLALGDPAPDFELTAGEGDAYRLSDFRGQVVVIAFYPADFSGVCTAQHAGLSDELATLDALEAKVFGVSVDSHHSHRAYAIDQGIRYPLLADFHPKGEVARRYGVYLDDWGTSSRTTFVIDPDGCIANIQESEATSVPDIQEVIEAVRNAR